MSEAPTWPGLDYVESICVGLKYYNDWRRGIVEGQPHPLAVGLDIDHAVRMLTKMAYAIRTTLDDNLDLADGDACTLIHLKRAAEKA